jgi:hypothetical protein
VGPAQHVVAGVRGDRVGHGRFVGPAVQYRRWRVAGRERHGVGRVVAGADGHRRPDRRSGALGQRVEQRHGEALLCLAQRHPVLRAGGAGDRRLDGRQVEVERLGERRLGRRIVPQALLLGVGLDQRHLGIGATGEPQVAQSLVVDGEDGDGRAVLGRHVADGRPVLERHVGDAGPVELDEPTHHAVRPQDVGDREHQVGGRGALGQFAGQLEAHHLGDEHRDGLAQQRRLGLDAADAPADDAEPVDHGRVRVGADERVGERHAVAGGDDGGEVFEVDLVADAGGRRHHPEPPERLLAPTQELVALEVALVLELGVAGERLGPAEHVDLHGVVDDEVGGDERVELGGVAAALGDRVAHGREVDDRGHAGEVLHQHPRGQERDLAPVRVAAATRPAGQGGHVVVGDAHAVVVAQQVLEQHLQRVRQPGNAEVVVQRAQAMDLVPFATGLERAAGVDRCHVVTSGETALAP